MSLRGLANSMTSAINPNVLGVVLLSTGSTTAATGKQSPAFAEPIVDVALQVQALTTGDLKKLDALNIQGVDRTVFIDGQLHGVERLAQKGGDFLFFSNAWWLINAVLEPWDSSGWCKVAVTQQVKAPIQWP